NYKSDIYSFGVVVWEVITTELPWENKPRTRDIMWAVLRGDRPEFPAHAHAGSVDMARRCWADDKTKRPTFPSLMQEL
ncbi:unnamed protein product, partial [Pylaiella littoralis]